ncbi:cytochrome c peroxidase [Sediminibacterium sp.]|uniref:cytochrome c peroxidase n=1 Tax=Sediminibacterium sp. TaxID=1917865 RepID=UPI003F72EEF6
MNRKGLIIGMITAAAYAGFLLIRIDATANISTQKARIKLGQYLFYDTKLSYNQTKTCVSCHDPVMAFTDGYRTSSGADGYNLKHNAISLLNVKYRTVFTWTKQSVTTLKAQLQFPFFNEHPKELGWKGNEQIILKRFLNDTQYQRLFKKAFPLQSNPFQLANVQTAIIAFEEQLVSYNAKYDRYVKGNFSSFSEDERNGLTLFSSNRLGCTGCHRWEQPFKKDHPLFSKGIRVPSLRNVLLTAPYMHDGRIENINGVLEYYSQKNSLYLTNKEKKQIISFLYTLTDTSYLSNKELLNPFQYQ